MSVNLQYYNLREKSFNHHDFTVSLINQETNKCVDVNQDGFLIPHGTTFFIQLKNYSTAARCDACIYIDGKFIGLFRINKNAETLIKRPQHSQRSFVFYKTDSSEGTKGGLSIPNHKQGTIEIIFQQETIPMPRRIATDGMICAGGTCTRDTPKPFGIDREEPYLFGCKTGINDIETDGGNFCSRDPSRITQGGTTLGKNTNQTFTRADSMKTSPENKWTIYCRMMCDLSDIHPL